MAHHWIRLAANPLELKVVSRAANTLGIHKAQALGHLSQLWSWLADRSDDGSILGLSDDEIEDAVEWTGTRGAFALFVRNRHVDRAGRIRDWEEFMGPLVHAREQARKRQQRLRQNRRKEQDVEADERLGRIPVRPPERLLCAYCQTAPSQCWDHVFPRSLGGEHEKRNIVPSCVSCNSSKSDGPVTDALSRVGLVSDQAQDAWADRYGVQSALEKTRQSFPYGQQYRLSRGGGSGRPTNRKDNLSRGQINGNGADSVQESAPLEVDPICHAEKSTEQELRKSLRTTGMYLGRELDLVSSESRDEKAFNSSLVKNQNQLDASLVHGIELVRTWSARFYAKDKTAMLDALRCIRATLRPGGKRFRGQTIRATPLLVVRAMNETLDKPPSIDAAAVVFVLTKLSGGHLHETRTETGELVTEALANDGRKLGRDTTANLMSVAPELFAGIKSMPVDPRKQPASGAWKGTAPPS